MPALDGVSDEEVRSILTGVSTIAVVGASPNPARPSNQVLGFLIAKGFETYPVNPGHAGGLIRGNNGDTLLTSPMVMEPNPATSVRAAERLKGEGDESGQSDLFGD